MKKLILLFVGLCITVLPSSAAMNFYRSADGQIMLEATNCNDVARLVNLTRLPDDPPTGETPEEAKGTEATQEDEAASSTLAPDVAQGVVTVAHAFLSKEEQQPNRTDYHEISEELENFLDVASFEELQDSFITFVRDVNWKTGMHITFRDYSFFRRLKMACSGINQLTKPMRMNMGAYSDGIDQAIDLAANAGVDKLAQAARGHSFEAMSKLSVIGLAIAIEKENPFLLLAMDEETYHKLVEYEPQIATLFEDMYTFFSIRAVRMGEYHQNIKALIDVAKIGKGDSFSTWHTLATYAKKMLELERQDKLNPEDEKAIHIWRLESSMHYIKEQVHVEKRAAELAAQDPNNITLIQKIQSGPKKKPSLDDKARALLKKSSQKEIEHYIRKYIAK